MANRMYIKIEARTELGTKGLIDKTYHKEIAVNDTVNPGEEPSPLTASAISQIIDSIRDEMNAVFLYVKGD